MIDEKIGQILKTLQEAGYLEKAVVIFTSDHGDAMEDHGHSQKWTMYDVITRMPMIAWSPNGRVRSGETVDGLCQLMDLGPTILELAGREVPADFEARTLLPALQGRPWTPRSHVFCEQAGDVNLTGCEFITSVRSDRWKLVHFKGSMEGQLFDMVADPGEVTDLWSSHRACRGQARDARCYPRLADRVELPDTRLDGTKSIADGTEKPGAASAPGVDLGVTGRPGSLRPTH